MSGERDDGERRRGRNDPHDDRDFQKLVALFGVTASKMNAVALARTGNKETAKDLVQEVFHKAWEARVYLVGCSLGHQRAWLFRVLANKIVDRYRRTAVHDEIPTESLNLELLDEFVDPFDEVVERDLEVQVIDECWAIIKQMPTKRQAVLTLWAHGMKDAEIATMLGVGRTTVHEHRTAGLAQLNKIVGGKYKIIDGRKDRESESGRES